MGKSGGSWTGRDERNFLGVLLLRDACMTTSDAGFAEAQPKAHGARPDPRVHKRVIELLKIQLAKTFHLL